jgi:hypothetical protein
MPFQVKMHVRYWDGRTVSYGQIVEVREESCLIRVGGTDRTVEVRNGHVSIHPAVVASGIHGSNQLLGPWHIHRLALTDRYLYHATAVDLIPSIIQHGGLVPRSRVNWQLLGESVYKGAEQSAGRVKSPVVDLGEYFTHMGKWAEAGLSTGSMPMGDVGEFLYATTKIDIVMNYVEQTVNAGKDPVVFRFKDRRAWYADPKSTAVMTMNSVPLQTMQVKFVGKKYRGIQNEDKLEKFLLDNEGWVDCSDVGWDEIIGLEQQMDVLW